MTGERTTIELAAEIAAAFVSNNSVRPADLPGLIGDIHGALRRVSSGEAAVAEPEKLTPAVPIKKSIMPDYVICLEDGRKFKSLKRHLRTAYDLTPD
jgi:predicted transcriptional regulator